MTTQTTGFTGFPDEALAFFEGLEADNSKAYFTDHKTVFDRAVREPMVALTDALAEEFGEAKIFRPNRDVRFSPDKSPYKTHQGAVIGMGGGEGSLYVAVSAEGLVAGGGFYQMTKDQVTRYRAAVEDDAAGGRLAAVVEVLLADGFGLVGETLKRAPRGTDPEHPRIELLRHKGIAGMKEFGSPPWLSTAAALDHVATAWRALAPLNAWLAAEVGAPEVQEGDERPGRRPVSPRGGGR